MHFSDKGSEVLQQELETSLFLDQSQWCHQEENRKLHAKLDYSGP